MKLFANLRVIKNTWPMLKAAKGHLVMIGGGTARTPERHLALVAAVNGGIAALSKSIAEQGLQDCVHVNLVQPGTIRTSRRKKLMEKLAAQEGIDYAEYLLDLDPAFENLSSRRTRRCRGARRLSRNRRSEMNSWNHHRCRWWSEQGCVNLTVVTSCDSLVCRVCRMLQSSWRRSSLSVSRANP